MKNSLQKHSRHFESEKEKKDHKHEKMIIMQILAAWKKKTTRWN